MMMQKQEKSDPSLKSLLVLATVFLSPVLIGSAQVQASQPVSIVQSGWDWVCGGTDGCFFGSCSMGDYIGLGGWLGCRHSGGGGGIIKWN